MWPTTSKKRCVCQQGSLYRDIIYLNSTVQNLHIPTLLPVKVLVCVTLVQLSKAAKQTIKDKYKVHQKII